MAVKSSTKTRVKPTPKPAALPPKPARGHRDNKMYWHLFQAIIDAETLAGFPGDTYIVKEFLAHESAYEARRLIEQRRRPVPGGTGRWVVVAYRVPIKDVKGDGVKSKLYATWKGPK